jgi:hypothetical protein
MKMAKKGWKRESARHALAAKGVSTVQRKVKLRIPVPKGVRVINYELRIGKDRKSLEGTVQTIPSAGGKAVEEAMDGIQELFDWLMDGEEIETLRVGDSKDPEWAEFAALWPLLPSDEKAEYSEYALEFEDSWADSYGAKSRKFKTLMSHARQLKAWMNANM